MTNGVVFTKYVKLILPLDGYVFWVKADLISPSALINALGVNLATPNQPGRKTVPATTIAVKGSLHYSSMNSQDEAAALTTNMVVFTSEKEIEDLNAVGPTVLFIGAWEGLRFAFSRRESFYQQAGLHHYVGNAVYADMETQLVDDAGALDTRNVVVSNSLPIWLAMNGYEARPWENFGNPSLPMYPSFLLPDNLQPPYAAIHIDPGSTRALASAPLLDLTLSHTQLATEKVKITLYGQRNYNAQDFVDFVFEQSLNTDTFGIMNMPILRDEKRTQVELGTLAMKKTIEFEINYNQSRVRDVARQLITSAVPTYYQGD